MGELPTPARANYDFIGWYTAATGGTRITASTIVPSSNVTYFARWVRQTVTITLNANGGTVTPPSVTRNAGAVMGELPTPNAKGTKCQGDGSLDTPVVKMNISKILVSTGRLCFGLKMSPNLQKPRQSTTNTAKYRLSGA